eukprot:1831674-Pleurochrysis_carterae.AAC.2
MRVPLAQGRTIQAANTNGTRTKQIVFSIVFSGEGADSQNASTRGKKARETNTACSCYSDSYSPIPKAALISEAPPPRAEQERIRIECHKNAKELNFTVHNCDQCPGGSRAREHGDLPDRAGLVIPSANATRFPDIPVSSGMHRLGCIVKRTDQTRQHAVASGSEAAPRIHRLPAARRRG